MGFRYLKALQDAINKKYPQNPPKIIVTTIEESRGGKVCDKIISRVNQDENLKNNVSFNRISVVPAKGNAPKCLQPIFFRKGAEEADCPPPEPGTINSHICFHAPDATPGGKKSNKWYNQESHRNFRNRYRGDKNKRALVEVSIPNTTHNDVLLKPHSSSVNANHWHPAKFVTAAVTNLLSKLEENPNCKAKDIKNVIKQSDNTNTNTYDIYTEEDNFNEQKNCYKLLIDRLTCYVTNREKGNKYNHSMQLWGHTKESKCGAGKKILQLLTNPSLLQTNTVKFKPDEISAIYDDSDKSELKHICKQLPSEFHKYILNQKPESLIQRMGRVTIM